VDTPALLVQTVGGSMPSMPPDLAASIDAGLVLWDYSEVIDYIKLKQPASFFSLPRRCISILAPDGMLSSPNDVVSAKALSVETCTGRRDVTPASLLTAAAALGADVAVCVSDEPPPGAGKKRLSKAAERTKQWLDASLADQSRSSTSSQSDDGSGGGGGGGGGCGLLGVVSAGGVDADAVRRSARDVAARGLSGSGSSPASSGGLSGGLLGCSLSGLGGGEGSCDRAAAVAVALECLPEHALRVALKGYLSPADIVRGMASGVDVIGSAYPYLLARNGQALSLPSVAVNDDDGGGGGKEPRATTKRPRMVAPEAEASSDTGGGNDVGGGVGSVGGGARQVLDLRDAAMRTDTRPLVYGCACHACAHHHRAYIHHLLLAHEMLGDVLLYCHNTHHLLRLFAAARRNLRAGTFDTFAAAVAGEAKVAE